MSFHQTDVTSWKQLSQLWRFAIDTLPGVDIVCPAAGIFDHPISRFWEAPRTETNPDSQSQDDADAEPGHYRVLDINLVAPMRLAQLAIGHWTKAKQKGCLVFAGSVAGFAGGMGRPLYHASKFGIHGFVQSLAPLRDEVGIRSGAVAPGAVKVRCFFATLRIRLLTPRPLSGMA